MNAGIYVRLSREKDTEERIEDAYERWEATCRQLCERRGWRVVEVYLEPVGTAYKGSRRRSEFRRALDDLASGHIKVLVAGEWARLSRNRQDSTDLFELASNRGVIVATADGQDTTTKAGMFALELMAMIARKASEDTSERVKLQQAHAAAKGRPPTGRRLFGYTKVEKSEDGKPGERRIVEDEARITRELVRRLLIGRSLWSLTVYANTVSTTTTGKPWSQRTLRSMLLSPGIAGLRQYQGEVVGKGQWEPIISRAQWERVKAVLNENHRPKAGRPVTFLLSTLAACGRCEAPLWGHRRSQKRGGGLEYACPLSPGRPGCGKLTVSAPGLEAVVVEMVLQRLAGPGLARMLAAQEEQAGTGVAEELNALDAQIKELEEAWRSQQIKMDSFLRMYQPLDERREQLRAQLQQQSSRSILWSLPKTEAELRDWWDDEETTLDQRRAVLRAVMYRVVVGPALRASRTFDAARLKPPHGPDWRG